MLHKIGSSGLYFITKLVPGGGPNSVVKQVLGVHIYQQITFGGTNFGRFILLYDRPCPKSYLEWLFSVEQLWEVNVHDIPRDDVRVHFPCTDLVCEGVRFVRCVV